MAKRCVKPATSLFPFPTPVVMVTCQDQTGGVNIITLAWVGVVNSEPPMIGIAIRPSRFSYRIIEASREFVINVPSGALLEVTDFCGVTSGAKVDKFEATGLTAAPSQELKTPLIEECPVNLECVVRQVLPLESHHLFIGEVVVIHVEEAFLEQGHAINIQRILPLAYCPGARKYWNLGSSIGTYGFTKGQL